MLNMAVVEVGMMGVQAGKTPMDPNTPDGSLLLDAWKAVITAAGGPQRVYWGTELGTWSRVWGFFDWESVEEHEAFARSYGHPHPHSLLLLYPPHVGRVRQHEPPLTPATDLVVRRRSASAKSLRRDSQSMHTSPPHLFRLQ
jgi:hypothetical protein